MWKGLVEKKEGRGRKKILRERDTAVCFLC